MPHARMPRILRRMDDDVAASPRYEPQLVRERRLLANLFALHKRHCPRQPCTRAGRCVGVEALCFLDNRQYLLDEIDALVRSEVFTEGAGG